MPDALPSPRSVSLPPAVGKEQVGQCSGCRQHRPVSGVQLVRTPSPDPRTPRTCPGRQMPALPRSARPRSPRRCTRSRDGRRRRRHRTASTAGCTWRTAAASRGRPAAPARRRRDPRGSPVVRAGRCPETAGASRRRARGRPPRDPRARPADRSRRARCRHRAVRNRLTSDETGALLLSGAAAPVVGKLGIGGLLATTRLASHRQATRVYRVDRVRGATQLDLPTRRPEGFDLPAFWATGERECAEQLPRLAVDVRLGPTAQRHRDALGALAPREVARRAPGRRRVGAPDAGVRRDGRRTRRPAGARARRRGARARRGPRRPGSGRARRGDAPPDRRGPATTLRGAWFHGR